MAKQKLTLSIDKDIKNPSILNEIRISSELIITNGSHVLESEICRLCRLINKK